MEMSVREKVLFSWSGGKDSALALHELRRDARYEVTALLTSLAEGFRRISHHGVREELLDRQAAALGLPLEKVYFPVHPAHACTNAEYEEIMGRVLQRFRDDGVTLVAHGDIFLQDLRNYRERNLARIGLRGLFPLWQRPTTAIMDAFIAGGFQAYVTCVDGARLGRAFAGRPLDRAFVRDLPATVDPAGENGEYHSYVFAGPIFRQPISVRVAEIVAIDQRFYAELLPADMAAGADAVAIPRV